MSSEKGIRHELYEELARDCIKNEEDSVLYNYLKEKGRLSSNSDNSIRDFFDNHGYSFRPDAYKKSAIEYVKTHDHSGTQDDNADKKTKKSSEKNNDLTSKNDDEETRMYKLAQERAQKEIESVSHYSEQLDKYYREHPFELVRNKRREPRDQTIELLRRYYERIGKKSLFSSDDEEMADLKKEEIDALYALLSDKECGGIRIPLLIDDLTGCSLELVGKNYYPHAGTSFCAFQIYHFGETEKGFGIYRRKRFKKQLTDFGAAKVEYKIACDESLEELRENNSGYEFVSEMTENLKSSFSSFFSSEAMETTKKIKKATEDAEMAKRAADSQAKAERDAAMNYINSEAKPSPAARRKANAGKKSDSIL